MHHLAARSVGIIHQAEKNVTLVEGTTHLAEKNDTQDVIILLSETTVIDEDTTPRQERNVIRDDIVLPRVKEKTVTRGDIILHQEMNVSIWLQNLQGVVIYMTRLAISTKQLCQVGEHSRVNLALFAQARIQAQGIHPNRTRL